MGCQQAARLGTLGEVGTVGGGVGRGPHQAPSDAPAQPLAAGVGVQPASGLGIVRHDRRGDPGRVVVTEDASSGVRQLGSPASRGSSTSGRSAS